MSHKKKVGIITHYYKSTNYGGNLQAYALCKFLNNNGYLAEQICFDRNVKAKRTLKRVLASIYHGVKNSFKGAIHYKTVRNLKLRQEKILDFNKNVIPHSKEVYTKQNIAHTNEIYDAFITGSDQVWHPKAVCDEYLLAFADAGKTKISYAASLAIDALPQNLQNKYKEMLESFSAVSVREENAIDIIKPLTDKQVVQTIDPVLLLSKEKWDSLCSERRVDEEYLFCYFLGESEKCRRLAEEYAKSKNLKVVTLPDLVGKGRKCDKGFGDVKLYDVDPQAFISLIKNAYAVFTDSFHAAVFSIIYSKFFVVFERAIAQQSMSSRICSLMDMFDMSEHFCNSDERMTLQYILSLPTPDYAKEFPKYTKKMKDSVEFLFDNLSKVNDK